MPEGRHRTDEKLGKGHAEQRRRVDRIAGAHAHQGIGHFMGAIFRHEDIVHLDVMAAGALQAVAVPGIDDLVILPGQQEGAGIHIAGFGIDHATEENPVAMFGTRGEPPMAGEAVTALDRGGLAGHHIGRGNQDRRVLAPDILRRLIVEQRHLPIVATDHAIAPGRRHVALAEGHQHVVEDIGVHFIAAPALRLKHAEQAGVLEIRDGFGGQAAGLGCCRSTFAKHRDEGAGAAQNFLCIGHGDVQFAAAVHDQFLGCSFRLGQICRPMLRRMMGGAPGSGIVCPD